MIDFLRGGRRALENSDYDDLVAQLLVAFCGGLQRCSDVQDFDFVEVSVELVDACFSGAGIVLVGPFAVFKFFEPWYCEFFGVKIINDKYVKVFVCLAVFDCLLQVAE